MVNRLYPRSIFLFEFSLYLCIVSFFALYTYLRSLIIQVTDFATRFCAFRYRPFILTFHILCIS